MRTTPWQIFRFAFVYFNSQSGVFLVPALLQNTNYEGWMGIVAGNLLSLGVLWCMVYVGKTYPQQPWLQFGQQLFGKGLHVVFVLLLLLWCVYYASYDIESFVLFFGSNYLQDTPAWFIQIVIAAVIVYTAMHGFRIMVYLSDALFLMIAGATILMFFLFSQQAELSMLSALLHHFNTSHLMTDTITTLSWFAEWVVFFFIVPDLKLEPQLFKKLATAATVLTLLVLCGWLLVLLYFGPQLSRQFQYPYLEMIRSMTPDGILSKVAPLLIGVWTASMFIHSSFLIYVAAKCVLYFTKNKGEKGMVPVLTVAATAIA